MKKTFPIPILVFAFICTGCSKVALLDDMMYLKKVGQSVDETDAYVAEVNKKFAQLVKDYHADQSSSYSTKDKTLDKLGNPIQIKAKTHNDQQTERWLYREAVNFFDSEKIYLYFSNDHVLVDWEYLPEPTPAPTE